MQVRALRHGDYTYDGRTRALFAGQVYDVPEQFALDNSDWLEPLEQKAVEGPPSDKAVRTRRTKGAS